MSFDDELWSSSFKQAEQLLTSTGEIRTGCTGEDAMPACMGDTSEVTMWTCGTVVTCGCDECGSRIYIATCFACASKLDATARRLYNQAR